MLLKSRMAAFLESRLVLFSGGVTFSPNSPYVSEPPIKISFSESDKEFRRSGNYCCSSSACFAISSFFLRLSSSSYSYSSSSSSLGLSFPTFTSSFFWSFNSLSSSFICFRLSNSFLGSFFQSMSYFMKSSMSSFLLKFPENSFFARAGSKRFLSLLSGCFFTSSTILSVWT
jgi:hypothetical protein